MKKQRNWNYQKRAYRAECTQWTGDNLPEVSNALLELGYDDIKIERGTVMARCKGKPLLCVSNGNWLRFGEDDSFKVMRPAEQATYVPIQSDDELRDENDRLRAANGDLQSWFDAAKAELDALKSWKQNCEQHHFEKWLSRVTPSGDCESVDRQWLDSIEYAELYDRPEPANQEEMALVPVAWRVHPFEYGIGHEGVYALTMREEQVSAWKNKGWSVEAMALISSAQKIGV